MVANSLVYDGRLQCGSEVVAMGRLHLPLYQPHAALDWMDRLLDPQRPVIFVDTDGCAEAEEGVVGGQVCNMFEAKLVAKLLVKLRKVGLYGWVAVEMASTRSYGRRCMKICISYRR